MKGHYLMLVLPDGKNAIRREYIPLVREDEDIEEATSRWVLQHPTMVNRQRNRDRQERKLRADVIDRKLCRPTSWHRERCEEDGVPFPRPVGKRRGRRGR